METLFKVVLIGSKIKDRSNDIATHKAVKSHENVCKGIQVMEVLPIMS